MPNAFDMHATVTIRRALRQDADAMYALQQRAFAEEGRRCGTRDILPLMEQATAIAEHIAHHVALVATEGDVLVGGIRGIVEQGVCTVRGLVVEPTRQGAGLGTRLLRALEAEVASVSRIDLTTNTVMEGNVPFYERHGYAVVDRTSPLPGVTLAHMTKTVGGVPSGR